MNCDNSERRRRGPYRTKQRIPRQTVYSRKKKLSGVIPRSSSESCNTNGTCTSIQSTVLSSPEHTSCEYATCVESSNERSLDNSLLASDSNMEDSVLATPPTSEQLTNDEVTIEASVLTTSEYLINNTDEMNNEVSTVTKLYEGSSLSVESSHILISSYMCRHHLTGQAREDLLQLLRIHLPKTNQLPSSSYTFNKQSDHTRDITPIYHYYCHECYSLLPSDEVIQCHNTSCNANINKQCISFFITIPIADQLKVLLSSKHIMHGHVITIARYVCMCRTWYFQFADEILRYPKSWIIRYSSW